MTMADRLNKREPLSPQLFGPVLSHIRLQFVGRDLFFFGDCLGQSL